MSVTLAAISDSKIPTVLERARAGDVDAFLALVQEHEPALRRLVARMLGRNEQVPDVLQETFLRAFRALLDFRGESSLGTWLYRIAYNICLDELRRPRLWLVPLDEAAGQPCTLDVDPLAAVTSASSLANALAALPAEDRAAVLLVDGDGFDYASAGEILGVPAGTIASRLNRARSALRRALADPQAEGLEAQ